MSPHNELVTSEPVFHVGTDAGARAWLDSHPESEPRVIAYQVKRCCGGGKICLVRVRGGSKRDDLSRLATAQLDDGTRLLVDQRAAARLPRHFGLTVPGSALSSTWIWT